jgi:small conductance mechanosensitive channel
MILNEVQIITIATKAARIGLIIILAFVSGRIINFIVNRFRKRIKKTKFETETQQNKRLDTLSSLIKTSSSIIISLISLLLLLSELGVDILPLLTGVGVLGLGVGMGAKSLVSDVIAGFFILLENQFNVGDKVKLGGKWEGIVKEITMRTVILKDEEGKSYIIPNSQINTVIKY